jgi:cytosine/adenosine deaminase-related metal-dependent hydrolase
VQVTDADINLLRRRAVSVVHCIRSNQRLRHGLAPLKKFREAGLTLGLGTDSLASSPDLSMLSEANQVAQQHKMPNGESVVNHTEALGLITLSAAQVIGLDKQIGSLEKGKIADVAVFQYGKKVETDPVNALFSSETKAVTVYVGGRIARLPA